MKVPIKMSRQEFLDAVNQKIISSQVIDPARLTKSVLAVITNYVAPGEIEKAQVKHSLPKDLQTLWAGVTKPE